MKRQKPCFDCLERYGKSDGKYENHKCNEGFYLPLKCNINYISKCKNKQCVFLQEFVYFERKSKKREECQNDYPNNYLNDDKADCFYINEPVQNFIL